MMQNTEGFYQLKHNLTTNLPITSVLSFFDYPDESQGLISINRKKTLIIGKLPQDIINCITNPKYVYKDFENQVGKNPLSVTFGGNFIGQGEVGMQIAKDLKALEDGEIPVLIFLLIVSLRGVVAILIPINLIVWTLVTSFTALRLVAIGFNVTSYVTDITLILVLL